MTVYILVLLLALVAPQAGMRTRDAKAVQAAKNTSVHRLEPSLPDKPFGVWLRKLVGPKSDIKWEVNDCGEQTGDPQSDRGRDFPMCAEAQVTLVGKRKLSVALSVGTFKTGVKAGAISFYSAAMVAPDGSVTGIKNLSQVPDAIKGE
jgi:hypothetical protein